MCIRDSVEPVAAFTATDHKDLRRLLRKFGADRIITEMQTLRPRGPGRPHSDDDIDVAYCIEESAEQYRQEGRPHPYKDAQLDLYELLHSPDKLRSIAKLDAQEREEAKLSGKQPPPSHFHRWWQTYKNKLRRGRKVLRRQVRTTKSTATSATKAVKVKRQGAKGR